MEQPTLHRLEGISPRAFQHPADKAATAALAQIPGVDQVVRNADVTRGIGHDWYRELEARIKALMDTREQKRTDDQEEG